MILRDRSLEDVQRLSKELGITPEEVVADGIAFLAVAIKAGLHNKGRLDQDWPAMHALAYWAEISKRNARKLEAVTGQGRIIYVPRTGTLGSSSS